MTSTPYGKGVSKDGNKSGKERENVHKCKQS